jgi:hypothetical protein
MVHNLIRFQRSAKYPLGYDAVRGKSMDLGISVASAFAKTGLPELLFGFRRHAIRIQFLVQLRHVLANIRVILEAAVAVRVLCLAAEIGKALSAAEVVFLAFKLG